MESGPSGKDQNKKKGHLYAKTLLRKKYWPFIEQEINRGLMLRSKQSKNHTLSTLSTRVFNQFLKAIQVLEVGIDDGSRLQLMDKYYLWAKQAGISPDAVTFNTLLKANRMCSDGIRGGLVLVHLQEMIECGIPADSYTTVELLAMCAKCPQGMTMNGTMTNKQVADAEFSYYVNKIYPLSKWKNGKSYHPHKSDSRNKIPPAFVFNTYLDVYATDGDVEGMHRLFRIARRKGIIGKVMDQQMKNTVEKGKKIAMFFDSDKVE